MVSGSGTAAWNALRAPIVRHLESDRINTLGKLELADLPGSALCPAVVGARWRKPFSIVLSTRDRPDQLAGALLPLKRLRYDSYEVLVVDNAPSGDETAGRFQEIVGDDPRFRYTLEPRPGLSRARNRGLAEATHDHVAFTDDDALVDPLWLDGLARGFGRSENVGCVTGLVPSAQLDTPPQRYFDQRVWWSAVIESHLYDLATRARESRLFPYDAGRIGTGANFAVDRNLMRRLGGFDEALGAGSPTRGGEDSTLLSESAIRPLDRLRTLRYRVAHPSSILR